MNAQNKCCTEVKMTHELAIEILNYNFKALLLVIRSPYMAVETGLRKAGVLPTQRANQDHQNRNEMIIELHKQGYSRRKIAGMLGITPSVVYYVINPKGE